MIVDDALDESDETLSVILERAPGLPEVVAFRQPDGTACPPSVSVSGGGCYVTVTIVDNDEAPNVAPAFTSSTTFNPAENQTAVGTVAASDDDTDDAVMGYALSGGADQALFSIGSTSGALTFQTAPNYEDPQDADTDNAYLVTVQATSGTGDRVETATQSITVTVGDDKTEAPGAPDAPSVSSASVSSLNVNWTAPDNAGPAITDYDYQYRTSSPVGAWVEVTSTMITALSATITGLAENTSYDVQVRATNDEGTGAWSSSGSGATDANAAPAFTSSTTFTPAENQTAVGTVRAEDSDAADAVMGYALTGGADQALFSIGSTSGVLTFQTAPNYEDARDADNGNTYEVEVQATSGTGDRMKTATQTITVTVTDDDSEAPGAPDAPSVSSASVTSLSVTWPAPDNAGPPITDYDYRHRTTSPQGTWVAVTNTTITVLSATTTGLAEDTSYDVQVRATNDEGTGAWSSSGSGATDANAVPAFTSSTTFTPAENQTAVGTVRAEDSDAADAVAGYALTGGADQALFSIGSTSGVLTFQTAPNYEDARDADNGNTYEVEVQATSGTGDRMKTATQTITVTVTDDDSEAPGAPDAPSVSAASVTSLSVTWPAPDNAGPPITDYDYRHRTTSPQGAWVEVTSTTITALSATITGLAENTSYDVQVRATNDEGTGGWSASGSGAPGPLPPPQDVNAEPKLPGEIRLSWWRNPNDASHDLVDRHQYRYRVRNASTWTVDWTSVDQTLLPGTAEIRNYNSVLLKGLTAGTTYEFQVRSMNTDGRTSAAVSAMGTATGRQMVGIEANTSSVAEGKPLRFTVSRDQSHGRLVAIVRISETEDMLLPDGRDSDGFWHQQVHFGDGNDRIPLVLETVNDGGGTDLDSDVTVEVMSYPLGPDNPDEHLYDVHPKLGSATITVTAAESSSQGGAAAPLTAAFEGLPEAHDGESAFTFRLAFSEAVAVTPEAMRTRVLTVAGGAVTGAARIDGETGVWAITVTPATREALSISLAPAADCAADGAVCTSDGRALSNGAAAIVNGPGPETQTQPDLTAAFEGLPASHDGESAFSFRVAFSDGISISYKTVRDASFRVTGGDVTQASRVGGRRDLWRITVEPDSDEAVTVRLPETTDCGASGAICTGDGRPLSHSLSATVSGPVGISVADARVEEGAGAALAFAVTLSRAASAAVTVDYATADGSAQAGDDYRAASGR